MYESLGQAAAAAGVSKSTILRAIKAHKISATRSDDGDWIVDPSELFRHFKPKTDGRNGAGNGSAERHDTDAAREIIELLKCQLDDLRRDRDCWREQAQAGTRLLSGPKRPFWRRLLMG